MNIGVLRRSTCRLCEGNNFELVLKLTPTPIGDHYVTFERLKDSQETFPLDLFLCRTCGGLQLLDVVDPSFVYGNYIYQTSISLGLTEHFKKYAIEVLSHINPPKGSLVIDIGSNDGTLLKFFQESEMSVLGIDPSPEAVQKANKSGIETIRAFFNADIARVIKNERGKAAIITANNVIANIDNLAEFAEALRELMASDGIFVFETGYALDLIEKNLIDNIYHEHLSYFAVGPLDTYFCRYGLELIDVERISTKGGSLRGMVQLKGGPRPISPSVGQFKNMELSYGITHFEIFQVISKKITSSKKQLSSFLSSLRKQSKTIIGYGASVGVTTLLYLFELADVLSFMVDDNPSRHNLFSPGHHIPVLDHKEIYMQKPDYVLILAWRYFEPIMNKHQEYLNRNGHFIVPFPEIKVI